MAESDERPARPWDLLDKELRVKGEVADARLAICKACESYLALTHQCQECGCFMDAKARLANAFCPLRKWAAVPSV